MVGAGWDLVGVEIVVVVVVGLLSVAADEVASVCDPAEEEVAAFINVVRIPEVVVVVVVVVVVLGVVETLVVAADGVVELSKTPLLGVMMMSEQA